MTDTFLQDLRYGSRVLLEESGIYRGGDPHAGFGHWSQHGDL